MHAVKRNIVQILFRSRRCPRYALFEGENKGSLGNSFEVQSMTHCELADRTHILLEEYAHRFLSFVVGFPGSWFRLGCLLGLLGETSFQAPL
jgi:hypothetical protein